MSPNFSLVKKGYDPQEVDDYIMDLKSQLDSYRSKDNAIKNALINAEIAADNIIKNAKLNATQIKYDAEDEAVRKMQEAYEALDEINNSIVDQKQMLSEFQKDYNTILNKYLKNIDSPEYLATFNKICALEDFIHSLKGNQKAVDNIEKEKVQGTQKSPKLNTQKVDIKDDVKKILEDEPITKDTFEEMPKQPIDSKIKETPIEDDEKSQTHRQKKKK